MSRLIRSFVFAGFGVFWVTLAVAFAQEGGAESGGGLSFDAETISYFLNLIFGLLMALFGQRYAAFKGRASSWMQVATNKAAQVQALIDEIAKASQDDTYTPEELRRIQAAYQALINQDRKTMPPPA